MIVISVYKSFLQKEQENNKVKQLFKGGSNMRLGEEIKFYKESKEKINSLRSSIIKFIQNSIIEVEYVFQRMNIIHDGASSKADEIVCYYPVLKLKECYKKKHETFKRKFNNCVMHEYILVDEEGLEIKISEQTGIEYVDFESNREEFNFIRASLYYPSKVEYTVTINEEKFMFEKKFEQKESLKELLKGKILKYDDFVRKCLKENEILVNNQETKERYCRFLSRFGIAIGEEYSFEKICDSSETVQIPSSDANAYVQIEKETDNSYRCVKMEIGEFYVSISLPIVITIMHLIAYTKVAGEEYKIDETLMKNVRVKDEFIGKEVVLTELL